MYTVFIALHAATASAALLATLGGRRRRWFAAYRWSLVAMLVFLVLAVAVDWTGRDAGRKAVAAGLIGLGGVMVWKAERARRVRCSPGPGFVDHTGFTIVGLVDAFVVVAMFNLGLAGWAVAAIGVAIAAAGHLVIVNVRARASRRASAPVPPTRSMLAS